MQKMCIFPKIFVCPYTSTIERMGGGKTHTFYESSHFCKGMDLVPSPVPSGRFANFDVTEMQDMRIS
jgi:hypothetical protein